MCRGKPCRTRTDDSHLFAIDVVWKIDILQEPPKSGQFFLSNTVAPRGVIEQLLDQSLGRPASRCRIELVGNESFQRSNRHRFVDIRPATRRLAGGTTDTTTNRGQRIGAPRDQVGVFIATFGDCTYITASIGMHGTSLLALDLPLPVVIRGYFNLIVVHHVAKHPTLIAAATIRDGKASIHFPVTAATSCCEANE